MTRFVCIRNRFDTAFGPSYDGIVVHSFKNKVGEYLERMARYNKHFVMTLVVFINICSSEVVVVNHIISIVRVNA